MPLALRRRAAGHCDLAIGMKRHARSLPALTTGLNVERHTNTHMLAMLPALRLLRSLLRIVQLLAGQIKRAGIVARIEQLARGRGVRHLL